MLRVIHNTFIKCDLCEEKINLRAQIGYYDIPFNIHCPNCSTHIQGRLNISQESIDMELKLVNAKVVNENVSKEEKHYSAELSAEFPTNKIYLRDFHQFDLSPFIRNQMFYGDSFKAIEATRSAMLFADHFVNRWEKIKPYYNLFWNKKKSLLYPKLEKEVSYYEFIPISKVNNELDAIMVLHQLFITTTSLTSALHPGTLTEYTKISELILTSTESVNEIHEFVGNIFSDFNSIEKKASKLIDSFSKMYDQLIPVVALKNEDRLNNVDKEKYGIMTTNFEQLSDFYAKSYEWILDNINIVIALNNIISRNDYTDCFNGKKYKTLFKAGSKINRLNYINELEPFSTPTSSLNNRIRNAIQHFDSEIDYMSQKITFTDSFNGKTRQESMYLIEFANLCIENFSIIIYILQLIYNLRRVYYLSSGIVPSFISKTADNIYVNQSNIKIGRNDPCFCGSGKKYKKCCI